LSGTNLITDPTVITNTDNSTTLTAFVPTNALQIVSFLQISVKPVGGGAPIGSQGLTVGTASATVVIGSISPVNVTQNQTGIALTVVGVGFDANCKIVVAGNSLTTTTGTANGATTLTATVNSDITKVKDFFPYR